MLTSELFLTHYNPDLEIRVASDASSYDVGACIPHKMTDGTLKPIAHASRALLLRKKSFANRKRISWDYIHSLKVPPLYLWSKLHSTNRPQVTTHHFWLKKGLSTHTAIRLQRRGTILLNHNFKMEYLSSKKFGHADGLLRLIPKYKEPLEDTPLIWRTIKNYSL